MDILPKKVTNLIDEFAALPGIGPKTASRLAFYLLSQPEADVIKFGTVVQDIKSSLQNCSLCFNISEEAICPLCSNNTRDKTILMVVSEPLDIVALEKTGFKGLYFVLGGAISPIDGIGPEDLRIAQLLERLKTEAELITEAILATNPSLEGEATALYIARQIDKLKENQTLPKQLAVTRIARGLPVGGDVEYADEVTLARALEGRKAV